MGSETDMLHYLAKNGFSKLKTSTLRIARDLHVSQQTVSRKLRELESSGMIERQSSPAGVSVAINKKGIAVLRKQYDGLCRIFNPQKKHFTGAVKKGIGEGKYYVSMPQYQKEFIEKIGFLAYPGTLNIVTESQDVKMLLSALDPIKIKGFETKSRTYGSIDCYKAKINDEGSAIIIPERTRHAEDIVEIIAPVCLREKLRLKDGSKVKVKL